MNGTQRAGSASQGARGRAEACAPARASLVTRSGSEGCSPAATPGPSCGRQRWVGYRGGDRALEMLLFGKPLLQNDPEEFMAFSITQFSLP